MKQFLISSKLGNINVLEGKDVENIKGIILNIHGVGSHFQFVYPTLDELSYRDNFFSKFGYKTFGLEFYGHGKSNGIRCLINNFDDLICDLVTVLVYIRNRYPETKIYTLAESMGGAVVLKYIIQNISNVLAGAIFISPMCGIDDHLKPNPVITKLLLLTSHVLPRLKLALTTRKMSSESAINDEYIIAKNLCSYSYNNAHRLGTVRELYKTSLWIPDNCHNISIPILMFHGFHDKITPISKTIEVFNKINQSAPIKEKGLVLLPNSEHCLLVPENVDDLTPNYIYVKILAWLE